MILDKVENLHLYKDVNQNIDNVIEFISSKNILDMEPGRYDLDDKGNYFMINEYTTGSDYDNILEAHKIYIDLQYIVSGEEVINYEPISNQILEKDYDEIADYIFYKKTTATKLHFSKGQFAIFFPNDLHMPAQMLESAIKVKKIVFKLLLNAPNF